MNKLRDMRWKFIDGIWVLIALTIVGLVWARLRGATVDDLSDAASILIPLLTLYVVLATHREVLGEQAQMRRLQTRPQVLAYFERKRTTNHEDGLAIVIKHFGGGPALDVQFSFDPPLRNRGGMTFEDEMPFSTGIPIMPPGFVREVEFDAYGRFVNYAGFHRVFYDDEGQATLNAPVSFKTTITLRDPIGDDQHYSTQYTMDLAHLMPYPMRR